MTFTRLAAVALSLAAGVAGALLASQADAARTFASVEAIAAANTFLEALPAKLRAKTRFAFDSPERLNWHFIPKSREGASLLDLDDAQSELLGPLLASALSPEGLLSARGVLKHENILRFVESEAGVGNASRRDPGLYYTTVFGAPSTSAPWGWRFEGHHLSVNVTQLPGSPPAVGPVFLGANPARVRSGPNEGFRLLADEEDLGRALVTMLAAERRQTALIRDTAFADIVTGNDPKVRSLDREGVSAESMSNGERQQLRRLVDLYLSRLTAESAAEARARLERSGFGKLHFAWAGGLESGQAHYYRVHGPTLLIEYDNTQNGANHIHTVYRDLDRDFGGDALRAHYRGGLSDR